jgi:hypothetical protein
LQTALSNDKLLSRQQYPLLPDDSLFDSSQYHGVVQWA